MGKTKKSNKEIIDELREQLEQTEIDLWAEGYFSFAVAAVIGAPKMASTYSVNMATMLISYRPGSVEKSILDLANALIIHRFQSTFKGNSDLTIMARLKLATQATMDLNVEQPEVMAVKQVVLAEFGFDKLLHEINRDPKVEALSLVASLPSR